jgi:NAD-dependent deacetylase
VAERLRAGGPILVLTGAGVSAESGLATFRGPGGLWEGRDPMQLATPEAFRADPLTVWRFYAWRRSRAAAARPNAAHRALAALEQARPDSLLVTQNVDGLHERAGTANVIRFHGSIWELRCARCCGAAPWEDWRAPLPALPPTCAACGGLARPGVVWFGEAIDPDVLDRAGAAAEGADVFLSIGTSSLVYPAAGLLHHAKRRGAFTVEINPDATEASPAVDLAMAAPAEDALRAIDLNLHRS